MNALNEHIPSQGFPLEIFRTAFQNGAFVKHCVVDGLFNQLWLCKMNSPASEFRNNCMTGAVQADLNEEIWNANLTDIASKVTGIGELTIVSPELNIISEGKCDPVHDDKPCLFMFIYLNPFWMTEMGGCLEISRPYIKPIQVNPIFNRTVFVQAGKDNLIGHPSVIAKGHSRFIKIKLESNNIK